MGIMHGLKCPYSTHHIYGMVYVRLEKFQFLEKGQNRNFGYEIIISVKNPEFILWI